MTDGVRRSEEDLDSIELGTPGNGKIKVYLNLEGNSREEIERRIDLAKDALEYAKGGI